MPKDLSNNKLESLPIKERIRYFENLKEYCKELNYSRKNSKSIIKPMISKVFPILRNYNYEIIGEENIPSDGKCLFICNHSNSHDFFTAQEVFKKLGTNVSVFAAEDDLNLLSRFIFKYCDAVLIDRNNKESTKNGILDLSSNLFDIPGVIFGEGTWNLHPYKPMQQIKIGAAKIAAIAEVKVIPTIFEYVETTKICDKEKELYTNCIIKFGNPISISREESLIEQTNHIQTVLEEMRLDLWKDLNILKTSIKDVDQQLYLNHTYLKKFGAFGFNYDSANEEKFLFSKNNERIENEFYLNERNEFVPGITQKIKYKSK